MSTINSWEKLLWPICEIHKTLVLGSMDICTYACAPPNPAHSAIASNPGSLSWKEPGFEANSAIDCNMQKYVYACMLCLACT